MTPLVQPPVEDLRQIAQIAQAWAQVSGPHDDVGRAFIRVSLLVQEILGKLGEPSLHTMNVTQMFLDRMPLPSGDNYDRFVRDAAAAIVAAQLTGEPR